jgi:glycosyltransferase involved in cell wall biosynthesis
LTMTGFREPGYLWKLPVPFVWGPIGGAANLPSSFLPMMGWKEQLYYRPRNLLNVIQQRTAIRCRRAARSARHLWVIGDADQRLVERVWGCRAERLGETGALPDPTARARRRDATRPLRIVWSGSHIGRKALPVLLHALARLTKQERTHVELGVLGEGPETRRWRALAVNLGLSGHVRWAGLLPRAEALEEIARADVMAFTGIQEGTPHTVLEALSCGLPVICHDACGMGTAVNAACGVKVPLRDPETSIHGFHAAIAHLIAAPHELTRLSEGALRRAQELSWDARARSIGDTYHRVARERQRG